jgi:hypothetical protein
MFIRCSWSSVLRLLLLLLLFFVLFDQVVHEFATADFLMNVTPENVKRIGNVLISRNVQFHRRHFQVLVRIHVSSKPPLRIPFIPSRFVSRIVRCFRKETTIVSKSCAIKSSLVLILSVPVSCITQIGYIVVVFDCGILWSLPENFVLRHFLAVEGNGSIEKILFKY